MNLSREQLEKIIREMDDHVCGGEAHLVQNIKDYPYVFIHFDSEVVKLSKNGYVMRRTKNDPSS